MTSTIHEPERYFQLALFSERRVVSWSDSFPVSLPEFLLSKSTHALFAARSITTALFEGVDVPREQETVSQNFLNRKQIHTPDPSKAVVLSCSDDQVIAGYPLVPGLWLGLFSRGLSSLHSDNTGALLAGIALAVEVLPPLHVTSTESRLGYFWGVLHEFYQALDDDDDAAKLIRLMKYLHSLSRWYPRTIAFPQQLSDVSPFDATFHYEPSILHTLRPTGVSSRKQWWVVAACVLSNDGRVLKTEGISNEHASVFAWRYESVVCAKDSHLDYDNDVLLRSLYRLGPISLCVLTSQSEISQTPRVGPKELDDLAKRAHQILKDVKLHISA